MTDKCLNIYQGCNFKFKKIGFDPTEELQSLR